MALKETNFIKFLGTAGARYVVARQLRSSAGLWMNIEGDNILIDPGPGTLVKCFSSRPKLDPTQLKAIILTHRHIDHSTDINVMIEAMSDSGNKKDRIVITTEESITGEPVIFDHVRPYLARIDLMKPGAQFDIATNVHLTTPILHNHTAETYGLKFKTPFGSISYIVDTAYFDDLHAAYSNSDLLILNVVRLKDKNDRDKGILHLNVSDAEQLITHIRPKIAIITHFGLTMIRAKPWEIAKELSDTTGVKVIAASDGMKFDLNQLA
ncbi:MAG: MBL fold metallo-hydrolase [bacterium]|nr:MAG: MBL fold metallo-hydrolase [bacterium]